VQLPVIDVSALRAGGEVAAVASGIDRACREHGFFVVTGHGVDAELVERLDRLAREFFARPESQKAAIAMARGGIAWRGWFPVGGELTSGVADRKEGIYFGSEAEVTGRPLEGPNLFPAEPAAWRSTLLDYLDALTRLGQRLVGAIERGLGVAPGALTGLVVDPLVLFRIFHYPPGEDGWGVGEHTDYGLLTILRQDDTGGLQVRVDDEWIDVPPVPGSFVCNIGDMLERATAGAYRSTPHRVRNESGRDRISMPFFLDPGWEARVSPLVAGPASAEGRWDEADPHLFEGTYGDYVLSKVSKVFPALRDAVLGGSDPNVT
jgi:isopenicillin N synthase-like dioxygenase